MQQLQDKSKVRWHDDIYRTIVKVRAKIHVQKLRDLKHFHNPAHYSEYKFTVADANKELQQLRGWETYECKDSFQLNHDIFKFLKPNVSFEDSRLMENYKYAPSAIVCVCFQCQFDDVDENETIVTITGPKAIHDEAVEIIHESLRIVQDSPPQKMDFNNDIQASFTLNATVLTEDGREVTFKAMEGSSGTDAQVFIPKEEDCEYIEYVLTIKPHKINWSQ